MDKDRLKTLDSLYAKFNEELNKKFNKRDFDKIERLTQLIRELTENEADINRRTEDGIAMLKEKASYNNKTRFKIRKPMTVLCMCFVMLIVFNCISLSTWGTNIFSAIVKRNKDSISIDFGKRHQEIINLQKSPNDPYGIKTKCAEVGLYPQTPEYLPENFDLVNLETDEMEICTCIDFYYKNDEMKINISYSKFNIDDIPPLCIPADTYNINEIQVNSNTVYILKEDSQFTATYIIDNIVYLIYTDNVDYNECEKILNSFV
ncbi:MAG: DUF4367 domain-containing protein [Ruminococcus sp.]|nr:DUF4367 domain-containing protein [Ruminococcus sp.]MDE7137018.1 DUF4367 domain-containing protein [Ruminococcus sp.]